MKKIIVVFLTCVAAGIVASIMRHPDQRPMPDRFGEAMNSVHYLTYADPDFGYSFAYPSFFRSDEMPEYGPGHVQFSYHGHTDIVLECKVMPESVCASRTENFVKQGYLKELGNHKYYAHWICHRKRWYVLTVCYDAEFETALKGLLYRVKKWEISDEGMLKMKNHVISK